MRALLIMMPFMAVGQSEPPDGPSQVELPSVTLKHIGSIALDARIPPPPPIRDIIDFDIDDRGRIGFQRWDGDRATIVLLDRAGSILSEIAMATFEPRVGIPQLRWLGGDRWAVFAKEAAPAGKLRAWSIDFEERAVQAMSGLDCPATESIAGDREGGFVVYLPVYSKVFGLFNSFERAEMAAFDVAGRKHWHTSYDHGRVPHLPFHPSMAVTSDDRIVLLAQNNRDLVIFSKDGAYIKTMESGDLWYCMASGIELSADTTGGVVVNDPYGTPTIRRVTIPTDLLPETQPSGVSAKSAARFVGEAESSPYARSEFQPRYANGRPVAAMRGLRVSADGELWACDGNSILRLDGGGVVDRILGEDANAEILREVEDAFIDLRGRTYLLNGRTAGVHVFDHTGKRLHICQPAPADLKSPSFCDMAVGGDGSVYIWEGHTRYLRFSSDGKRLGFDRLGLNWVNGFLFFQPHDPEFWVTHDKEFHLVSARGERIRTIRHRPDGKMLRWLDGETVAPDGSIAVFDDAQLMLSEKSRDGHRFTINIYSKTAEPIRSLPVQKGIEPGRPIFNGELVVFRDFDDSLIIIDAITGEPARAASRSEDENLAGLPFFSLDGEQLWLLQLKTRSIQRYQVP